MDDGRYPAHSHPGPSQPAHHALMPASQPLPQQPPPGGPGGGGFMGGAPMDPETATRMWAQDGYMIDSGIASGSNTAAPSVMSGASSLHHHLCNDPYSGPPTPYEGYPGPSPYMTPQQQIHAAAFPGQQDSGPSDPDVNVAIPELVRLLSDADRAVVGDAAKLVSQLAKQEAARKVMMEYPDLVAAVVRTMNLWDDPNGILKDSCHTLYEMSQHEKGLHAIYNSQGIRPLVKVLDARVKYDESKTRSLVYYSVITLHNLLLNQKGSKDSARQEGVIPRLVNFLSMSEEKFLAIVTDCLHILVYEHAESKLVLLQCGGPAKLVEIVRGMQYEKLLLTTTRLLKVLSVCAQNKAAIVAARGLQALQLHLSHASHRLVLCCLITVRNLSNAANREEGLQPLLDSCLGLLGSSDSTVVSYCCGILRNLPCNNQANKAHIVTKGGTPYILRVLDYHLSFLKSRQGQNVSDAASHLSEDIVENSLSTLRHLTVRHPHAKLAQDQIRDFSGSQGSAMMVLAEVLTLNRLPLIKETLGLVKNVGASVELAGLIRDAQLVPRVTSIFHYAYMSYYNSQVAEEPVPVFDGVNVMEIVEACVGALVVLGEEGGCGHRAGIVGAGNVPYLVNLLSLQSDSVLRLVLAALADLAEDSRDAADQMEEHVPTLRALAAPNHPPPVPALANRCLHNIHRGTGGSSGAGPSWAPNPAASAIPDVDNFDEPFTDIFYQRAMAESSFPQDMDPGADMES